MAQKDSEKKRLVKLLLLPQDHDRVRLAAALRRTTVTEFVREVVLAETSRLTSNIELSPEPGGEKGQLRRQRRSSTPKPAAGD